MSSDFLLGITLKINQSDRVAAGNVLYQMYQAQMAWQASLDIRARIINGDWDYHPLVIAFAQHRELHQQKEATA